MILLTSQPLQLPCSLSFVPCGLTVPGLLAGLPALLHLPEHGLDEAGGLVGGEALVRELIANLLDLALKLKKISNSKMRVILELKIKTK